MDGTEPTQTAPPVSTAGQDPANPANPLAGADVPTTSDSPDLTSRVATLEDKTEANTAAISLLNDAVGKVAPAGAPIPATTDPASAEAPVTVDPVSEQHPNALWNALEPGIKWGIENGQIDRTALPQEIQDLLASGDLPPVTT